jgi:hypothetical protein
MPVNAGKRKRAPMPRGMSRLKMHAMRTMAEEKGLLNGKTQMLRGRMPETLVRAARKNTGIESDTELIRLGLETLANQDNYGTWLMSHYGTIPPDVDLEY